MIRVHPNGMGTRANAARRPIPQMDARQNVLPARKTAPAGRSGSEGRLGMPAGHSYTSKATKARTTPAGRRLIPLTETVKT